MALLAVPLGVVGAALLATPRPADPMADLQFMTPYMMFPATTLQKYDPSSDAYYSSFAAQIRADSATIGKIIRTHLKRSDGWTITQPDPTVGSLVCTLKAPGKPRYYLQYRAIPTSPNIAFLDMHDSGAPITGARLWIERLREKLRL